MDKPTDPKPNRRHTRTDSFGTWVWDDMWANRMRDELLNADVIVDLPFSKDPPPKSE